MVLACVAGGVSAVGAVATAEQFPGEGRLTGLALGATAATAVFGGFTPWLAQWLIEVDRRELGSGGDDRGGGAGRSCRSSCRRRRPRRESSARAGEIRPAPRPLTQGQTRTVGAVGQGQQDQAAHRTGVRHSRGAKATATAMA